MPEKILLIDDEAKITRTLKLYLEQAGYKTVSVQDGALAMPAFHHERPDLVILDILLPHQDGWEICRQIRSTSRVPIIMLTAQGEETDRIVGLELGADDYIAKPFSPREVVARVRAVFRRTQGQVQPPRMLEAGPVTLSIEQHAAAINGTTVELTPIEFDLLATLLQHPGQVFTRLQLLENTQDAAYEGYERAIDQHIKNLRAKLGDDARSPRYILTVYGVGYKFVS
ncbi:MAG TPA: response regulator transcription factor [Bellilinea sp.]|jgi:DNA-binding response OmpR family regulator|nr:DNA-binding response regulator [Anaerolineaceae bacterium]HML39356.1 response regulator transcription factor [Bellilinea sp.]